MLLWTDFVTEEHFGIIEKLKETGYDGIELAIGAGDEALYGKIGNHLNDLGMESTCVTVISENENITSPDAKIRNAGLDRLKWVIDMCAALGAKVLCGPTHSAFSYISRLPPSEDERLRSIETMRKAGEYAATVGVTITPEALNRFECYLYNTMADLKNYIEAVDHPNVRAMYDTHHANIEEKSPSSAIKNIAPYLKHFHISENDRGTPGSGQVLWEETFKTLKEINYDGWLTIEAFSREIPEFANAINVWRDYSPADEIYQQGYTFIKEMWAKY